MRKRIWQRGPTVTEESLDNVLAVIKGALNSDAVDVGIENARHLHLLDGRHSALGEKDEAFHVLLTSLLRKAHRDTGQAKQAHVTYATFHGRAGQGRRGGR